MTTTVCSLLAVTVLLFISQQSTCDGQFTDCGGLVETVTEGILVSPGYPQPYPPHSNCTWVLPAQTGSNLRLTFNDFRIRKKNDNLCLQDYVQILQPDIGGATWGRFCGSSLPPSILARGQQLTVNFVSHNTYKDVNDFGFSLTYSYEQISEAVGCQEKVAALVTILGLMLAMGVGSVMCFLRHRNSAGWRWSEVALTSTPDPDDDGNIRTRYSVRDSRSTRFQRF